MSKRSWQPPPMTPAAPAEPAAAVKVDEQVVRNVLAMNPDLRDGRTTFQVKKALERGEALSAKEATAPTARPVAANSDTDQARKLSETLDFFLTSKGRELGGVLDEIAARRRLLNEEEQRARAEMRQTLVDFARMLDPGVLAVHGREALQAHREILSCLGMTAADLLDLVKRGGQ